MAGAVAPIAGDVVPATVPTGTLLGPATTAKPQPAGMMNGGGGGHGDHGGFHIATVPNPTDDTDDVGPAAAAVVGGLGPVIGAFPGTPLTSTAPSGLVSPAISTASSALTVSRATMMLPLASSLALSVSATAAAAAAATTTTIASLPAASAAPTDDEASDGQCRLLGPFALVVQLALGGLALLSLVYKRWHEKPRRTVKVWFFDVSKQVVGSVLVHVANVFLSMLTSGRFTIKPVVPTVTVSAGPTVRRAVDVVQGGLLGLALRQRAAATSTADNDGTYVPNPCSFYLLNLAIDVSAHGDPFPFIGVAAR